MTLTDRTAVVSGATRGLGRAIMRRFDHDGASVVGEGRPNMDVSDAVIMREYARDCDKLDILVCNAAIGGPVGPFDTSSIAHWIKCIQTNFMGVANTCHAFIPALKRNGHGKIIIVSGGGATYPRPHFSAYSASKAGVLRFMECLAAELKPYHIDVNCMAPGLLNTSIHEETIRAGAAVVGEEEYDKAMMARETPPDFTKACDLAVWLASEASNGITGRLISVHHEYRSLTA